MLKIIFEVIFNDVYLLYLEFKNNHVLQLGINVLFINL